MPGADKAGWCSSPPWRPRHDSAPEAVFQLCSSFLSPVHMCLSWGLHFAFSFQKAEWDSSNNSSRNNPNLSSLKVLLFPEKAVAPPPTLPNGGMKGVSSWQWISIKENCSKARALIFCISDAFMSFILLSGVRDLCIQSPKHYL